MSYARKVCDGSDVYVYDGAGKVVCCMCSLTPTGGNTYVDTVAEMVAHLERHVEAGECVPEYVVPNLLHDARRGLDAELLARREGREYTPMFR